MSRKVSFSTSRFQLEYEIKEVLKIAKEIGADAVDLDLWGPYVWKKDCPYKAYCLSDEETYTYFAELKKYADDIGIEICQTHGQGEGFSDDALQNERLIATIKKDIIATAALGAPVCVIHNTTTIRMGVEADPAVMRDLSDKLFSSVIPFAKQYGVKIATETFGDAANGKIPSPVVDFFGDINEFIGAYQRIKQNPELADNFTLCIDTGHSNKAMRFGNPTPADVIRRCGSDISVLHLNDNDTLTDQHKLLFGGNIDWNDVFDALDEIGYNGVYNMELNLAHFGEEIAIDYAAFAIKVLKNFLAKRYGEN